jgi:hypothetical protein
MYVYASTTGLNRIAITLPHELKNGKWQIGLSELSYFKSKTQFPDFVIECDIIVPNIKDGQSSQILRRAFAEKNDISVRYNPVFYSDVLSPTIKYINLYLKGDKDANDSFKNVLVNCTLHIRRVNND